MPNLDPAPVASGTAHPPRLLSALLAGADVQINGPRPWDIQVYHPGVYDRVLRDASLGLGETYMEGGWDSAALDETFCRLLTAGVDRRLHGLTRWRFLLAWLGHLLINRQSRRRAFQVGTHHYDIGNDIYRAMLDAELNYSCGYWADAADLDAAQQAKLALICRKLALAPGMRLLDLGCGFGALSRHAALHHGVTVLGITISREQQRLASQRCAGLPVRIELRDYRDLRPGDGPFDRIASVGMFEHVGPANYRAYFRLAARLLTDEGLFLLHTIGVRRDVAINDPWIDKYIFPNGHLPSARALTVGLSPWFICEDWHNFGPDYDRTLLAWWQRFESGWPAFGARYGHDPAFFRMWKYYLNSCAGMFRARAAQLWQLVLSKPVRREVYRSVR